MAKRTIDKSKVTKVMGTNNSKIKLSKGTASREIKQGLELFNLPKVNLNDPEQVLNRIVEYFEICDKYDARPLVSGLALALDISRQYLSAIANDGYAGGRDGGNKANINPESTDYIKKTMKFMNQIWESNMVNGEINPVVGIFLGKNNFKYEDKVENVITPNNLTTISTTELEEKYKQLPEPDKE